MANITDSPPRAPPIKYATPLGTRWAREKAAAGGATAFDFPTDPKYIGPWILGECVGKGASGRVKIAKHRQSGQLAAVKILPIAPFIDSRNSPDTQHYIYEQFRLGIDREITMMKLMNHPNIMRIYDVFEGEFELFLVLEYVEGGELFDFVVNRGKLPPLQALEYFKQIIYGLNYAHSFSIVHRDLKPENILIASFSPPLIKIADWGMAAFAPPTLQLETSCGSPHYASPEIVNGEKYQGNATDIWSCGVILYVLLTGRVPFDGRNVRALLNKVKRGRYEMPVWIDPLAKDLLSRMLVVEAAKRITIPEILAHPWLTAMTYTQTRAKLLKQPTPPLPPSPSTLARPIASPDLIDPDLFSSLRIIWGRHADAAGEVIKRDLCAPVGQGVHAKAFYYLLGNYREESHRKRLVDGEETNDFIEYNGIRELRFDRGWKKWGTKTASSDAPRQGAIPVVLTLTSPRPRNVSNTVNCNKNRRQLIALPPPNDRSSIHGPSKERLTQPVGPRAIPLSHRPPCKVAEHYRLHGVQPVDPVRPVSSIIAPPRRIALGPRPQPLRRGYAPSHQTDQDTVIEERPDEGRRNTVSSIAPLSGQRSTMSGIPSPTFQGNCSPVSPHVSPDVRSPRPLPPAQTKEKYLLDPNALTISKLSNVSHVRTQQSPKPQAYPNRIQDARIQWEVRQDAQSKDNRQKRPPQVSILKRADKENQGVSTHKTPIASGARRASGLGLGMGIGSARDVCQEMGNVVYIGTGNSPATKAKERKGKPPAFDLPTRRTTLPALGPPMILSPPALAPNDVGPPNRLLSSPVVGEFRGWFSSLFNWKNNADGNGQNHILYSPDSMSKTCGDVGRVLEALGVIVALEKPGDDRSGNLRMTARLKCRVEELSVDPQTNTSLKPVRFRVDFTPIQQTRPLIRHSLWSPPLSPIMDNDCFFSPPSDEGSVANCGRDHLLTKPLLSAPNPGLTPRIRTSMLPAVIRAPPSGQNTPMPSPGLSELRMNTDQDSLGNDSGVPYGTLCGILLVYEKGSTSSFKTIWRKLKDVYCGSPTKIPALQSPKEFEAFSPMMVSTPTAQAYPKGQFVNTGC